MARSRRSPAPSRQGSSLGSTRGGGGGSSGGSKGNNKKNKPPPNHPTENDPLHRHNLIRNLSRNDAEVAAIQKVNRTLLTLRDEIVKRYGEDTMLDIGEGKIRLKTGEFGSKVNPAVVRVVSGVLYDPTASAAAAAAGGNKSSSISSSSSPEKKGAGSPSKGPGSPDGNKSRSRSGDSSSSPTKSKKSGDESPSKAAEAAATITTIPPDEIPLEEDSEQGGSENPSSRADLIRAYLLRYHLRRRLLNRLFRRLNRVSRAMDGESPLTSGLVGPNPPKYGDAAHEIDERRYEEFERVYGRKMEVKRRVQDVRDRKRMEEIVGAVEKTTETSMEITHEEEEEEEMDDGVNAAMAAMDSDASDAAPDGHESSGPSLEEICNTVEGVDEADLALLLETEAGYDKVVTYHDMTKSGGGRRGSPSGTGGGSSSAKKSPSKRSGGGSPIKVESSSASAAAAEAAPVTSTSGSDAAAAAAAAADDDAVPPSTPSGKMNGAANNGDSATPSSIAAATPTNSGDISPPTLHLIPGKIRKTITVPLAYEDLPDDSADFATMKYGTGLGAAHRSMNSRERELEHKRWKTDIVTKIPVQPTFAELGVENRVFNLEGRRKRSSPDADAEAEDEKEGAMEVDNKEEESESADMDADAMEVDGEDEKKDDDEKEEGDGDADDKETGDDDEKKKKEEGDEEAKKPTIFKQKKLISLAAAPSFYSQDLRRIRILQHELMIRSGIERAKKKVDDAKAAYDRAYKISTDLHNKKTATATSITKVVQEIRSNTHKRENDHSVAVNLKRNQWQKAYEDWVGRRMTAGLPVPLRPAYQKAPPSTPDAAATTNTTATTAQNGTVHGTPTISAKLSDSASTKEAKEAASTLGSVVDAVAKRSEGGGDAMTNNGHDSAVVSIASVPTDAANFPPFVEPRKEPSPECTEGQKQEALLRKSLTEISAKLSVAEEERKKAWRKMLKLKEEFPQYAGGPPRAGGGGGGARRKPAARTTYRAPAAPAAASYGRTDAYGQTSVYATGGRVPPAAYGGANYGYGAAAGYIGQQQIPMQQQQMQLQLQLQQQQMRQHQQMQQQQLQQQQLRQQQQMQQQQRMRPGVPTAPTGTMAMAAANAATMAAPSASSLRAAPVNAQAAASANIQAAVPRAYDASQQQQTAQVLAAYQAQQQQGATASVQARTFNDGSVAPTVPPKRGEDGLFLRPTGRGRKNMDWDATNGLWVPERRPD